MKKRKTLRNRLWALTVCLIIAIQPLFTIAIYAAEDPEPQSEPYEYTIPTEIISEENIELYGHKERYFKAEESMNEIKLINEDGTISAYMFDYPVKYLDDDGVIKDKSNKLHASKRNNYLYVNDENDIKTYFPKKITKKPIIIEADGFSVEIGIVTDSRYSKKGEVIDSNTVFYNKAFGDDTAIQYTPDFNGYKEDIILYSAEAHDSYSFEIKCEGLYLSKENGILNFISEESGATVFNTSPFYIYDSAEEVNEYIDTEYTVTKTDDYEYLLTVTLNKDYLALEDLTYPVYIDPALTYKTQSDIEDTPIYSAEARAGTSYGPSMWAYLGMHANDYGVGRLLMRLPALINNSSFRSLTDEELISVILYVYNSAYGDYSCMVDAYQFNGKEDWVEDSTTYKNIGSYSLTGVSASGLLSSSNSRYYSINLTNIAKEWRTNTSLGNKGIIIKNTNETSRSYTKCLQTKDYPTASVRPYIVVNYTDIIEDGNYIIKNKGSGLVVDLESASTAEGTAIQQWSIHTQAQCRWKISRLSDGYYTIKSCSSGKYIGVKDGSTADGTTIVQYNSYTSDKTKWTFRLVSEGTYAISSKCVINEAERVLAVPNSSNANGTDLLQKNYAQDSIRYDEWTLHSLDFSYVNYYDSTFEGNVNMISNIAEAIAFSDMIFKDICGVSFTAQGSATRKYTTVDNCELNENEHCNDSACTQFHHRDIDSISEQICPEEDREVGKRYVLWTDRPSGFYCDYSTDQHATVDWLGAVCGYEPNIHVLRIPGETNEEKIAAMSIILVHETVHTFGISDFSATFHSPQSCIMRPYDIDTGKIFYDAINQTGTNHREPFCSNCKSVIALAILTKICE